MERSVEREKGYIVIVTWGFVWKPELKVCCRDSQEPGPLVMSWVLWDSP